MNSKIYSSPLVMLKRMFDDKLFFLSIPCSFKMRAIMPLYYFLFFLELFNICHLFYLQVLKSISLCPDCPKYVSVKFAKPFFLIIYSKIFSSFILILRISVHVFVFYFYKTSSLSICSVDGIFSSILLP